MVWSSCCKRAGNIVLPTPADFANAPEAVVNVAAAGGATSAPLCLSAVFIAMVACGAAKAVYLLTFASVTAVQSFCVHHMCQTVHFVG